ncbi:DMT family transporter [Paraliomyxa miuraensis]|uniref:DMT family transporter n=1 Tax=Paraliomyxa miuraensis TaxID=376150 RepID=UPI00225B7917|nr:DMT family transporter [Paraliomyxa miuraensis]MCX4242737.1 DMT family transporter [Paraliomyxa miuraensis]
MSDHLGELAALGTAVCWTLTSLFFAAAGARIGSLVVNFVRLVMALVMLAGLGWATRGLPWPSDASAHAWTWLTLSGLIGFAFGDLCLFRALVIIGPRLGSLLMSFAPPLAALIGWLGLGETLTGGQWLGMALTVSGVAMALADRAPAGTRAPIDRRTLVIGVLLGLGGALGQAGGLVISKHGMGSYDPFAATQIRVMAGIVGFGAIFTVTRRWPRVVGALRQSRAMLFTGLGAVFGPFLGVSLSLIAVQRTSAGVAASLMALSPILIIPMVRVLHRERIGLGGVVGTVLAVAGVVLLVR